MKNICTSFYILFIGLGLCTHLNAQQAPYLKHMNEPWVNEQLNAMTLEQKVGQLLMPRGNYSGKPHDIPTLERWVKEYHVGGIVFFAGPPTAQVQLTNQLQALSKTPLLIGQDFEWGLGMRLDSADRFLYNMTLGAIQGRDDLLRSIGQEIGKQCKRIGVHVNYAPVVDVNNNPNNPVINFRSFGSNRQLVAEKGLAIMQGIQSNNVICTAKHFPGHGDTDVDSHLDLPLINQNRTRLDSVELYPFKKLIDGGLSGIMTAHLSIPALEGTPNLASTFSKNIVTNVLRNDLGFTGLTFTDAMDMQGAVKNFPKGEAMVKALLAGNDILETFMDVPSAHSAILAAVKNGSLPLQLINDKVRKMLAAKYWVGLATFKPIPIEGLIADINTSNTDLINRMCAEESVTCMANTSDLIPIKNLDQRIALVSLGSTSPMAFVNMCRNYTSIDHISIPTDFRANSIDSLLSTLKDYSTIITSLHFTDIRANRNYGINEDNAALIRRLIGDSRTIIAVFGNPFILNKIPELSKAKTLILGYQQSKYTEEASAQIVFGALPSKGKSPVFISADFPEGISVEVVPINRLSYGRPEQLGIEGVYLKQQLDSIIGLGLAQKAYPGGVLQVAYKGKVIVQKTFGAPTYEDQVFLVNKTANVTSQYIDDAMDNFDSQKTAVASATVVPNNDHSVQLNTLYDLASITKIAASALSIMQLSSIGKFDINSDFATYYPTFKGTNKASLKYKDMLTHRSGLVAWIPFWRNAVDTVATFNASLANNPSLSQSLVYDVKKPFWLLRLFGKKTKKTLNIEKTMAQPSMKWSSIITPSSITWKQGIFSTKNGAPYTSPVVKNLWVNDEYNKTLTGEIAASPVKPEQGYVYSDLHYYTYPAMVQGLTGLSFEEYLGKTYKSLGATTMGFNPTQAYPLSQIAPTEYDSLFRKQLIHGYVHDEGAALLGGISGHAGLFGTANDLSKLMQMYLNGGSYGGKNYINPVVLKEFTSYQYPEEGNRRGIAFDKKSLDPKVNNGPILSSAESYGHSGFTGTFTWVDPKYDLVYVFLSNRVYPTRDNNKISQYNIRTSIGDAIINAILQKK